MSRAGAAYITTNRTRTVLYTGSTTNIFQRIYDHKHSTYQGFASRYGCMYLVWYEVHGSIGEAFTRERRIKEWKRAWKLELIMKDNPELKDLSEDWFDEKGNLKNVEWLYRG